MNATHPDCIQNSACAAFTKLCKGCLHCGFYKPEAERRKSIRLTYCEDGLYRKIIKREDEDGREE